MKRWIIFFSTAAGLLLVIATGCKRENDNTNQNKAETITTVVLNFRQTGTSNVFNIIFSDPDGEGGNPPSTADDIILHERSQYECSILLINDKSSPATDINAEISAEAGDHQLYISPAAVNITVAVTDSDVKGLPLGLLSSWTTGDTGTGTVRMVLKHKPGNKAAGDAVTKGDTDIDLTFIAKIQ
jgi:hypothetical protein